MAGLSTHKAPHLVAKFFSVAGLATLRVKTDPRWAEAVGIAWIVRLAEWTIPLIGCHFVWTSLEQENSVSSNAINVYRTK